uniref:Uncharacterized protein LOC111116689 n=1 Tax=Crassostrea virginica TaxID=6565 RepID=A0A8B8C6P2_CRAVI|nr:uncharacterized protein LOC111116689 [Crassostrea virginica]
MKVQQNSIIIKGFQTMGNLIVITMFFTVIMYADSCQECYYNVGDYATCLGEEVCVYGAKYVEVECWLRSVKTDVVIEQLLVRGDCGNVSQFRTFCKQGVKAVKMITSDDSLSCSKPTTMTPKETHVNIPQKTTITETSSFYSDITPDYASTDSSTSLLRFSTEKRHFLLTSDLSSVTISTDVRKTDYSPDASTQKQTTHKKLSPDLKTSVSSTTPSPITHGDTTFSSPISHGGDTFNSTPPPPAVRQYPRRRPIQRGTRRLVSMSIRIRVSGMHLTIYLSFSLYLYYS